MSYFFLNFKTDFNLLDALGRVKLLDGANVGSIHRIQLTIPGMIVKRVPF